ncbi:50s ribosomal protein l6 [Lasius niger]|uniref:Large ribosomal subunit protein uL6 n=1 Tax=Lasius niger TaxID=67767 RepID=A0A0J7KQX4_LASNI|nr:50s ribosomal protein l6 [Lasius niger]
MSRIGNRILIIPNGIEVKLDENNFLNVAGRFTKYLEINGVGYRANVQEDVLNLSLGYSHPIKYQIPKGITIVAPKPTILEVSGIDKQLVGQVAAQIRQFRTPEPYKGKGIKYKDEIIRRKEGKSADLKSKKNIEAARKLGHEIAKLAIEKKIKQVVFDRGGNLYHGKVKEFAEAARNSGLEF